jgi:hypothetical protein
VRKNQISKFAELTFTISAPMASMPEWSMTALIDTAAMLAPGGRVRLVEVDASEFSGGIHRFHYSPFPIHPPRLMLRTAMKLSLDQSPYLGW